MIQITDKLIENGWIELEEVYSKDKLLSIARSLGNLHQHPNGEIIDTLYPTNGIKSFKGTFSNRFGYSSFPLHTDTAFWSRPSRYIVLGMLNQSNCTTYLINTKDIFKKLNKRARIAAKHSTYMINTFEGKKYTSVLFTYDKKIGFRYDPTCMVPINKDAKYFHNEFHDLLKDEKTQSIHWTGNKAVIIDNWILMHGRSKVSEHEHKRELIRIYTG